MSKAEWIYEHSPVFLQNAMLSAYGVHLYRMRFGGVFEERLGELLKSQWHSSDQLQDLQRQRLARLVRHAYDKVPYYKQLMRERGVLPADVTAENLSTAFPALSKADINRSPDAFIADDAVRRSLVRINTSGTSGSPLSFYTTAGAVQENYAFFARFLQWAGVQHRQHSATFAGRIFIPQAHVKPPFWRKNLIMRNQLFSSYHLAPQFLPSYVRELGRLAPDYIDSYPSAVYTVAKFMLERGLSLPRKPKVIVTSSETLLDYQREVIEKAFGCAVRDQYGNAEAVAFISQCEKSSYHVNPEYGLIEIVDEHDRPVPPGQEGELVCTGFLNQAMPLMRYRIGDSLALSTQRCECGRNFPVVKHILGRVDDLIVTPEGNAVGRLDPIFKGLSSIRETQIIQETLNLLTVKIVPGAGFDQSMADTLLGELRKRVGNTIAINVEILNEIPRTKAGKFKAVVSKLKSRPAPVAK